MTEHPVVATPLPDGADRAYAKSIALRYLIASTVILGASGLLGMILRDSQAGAGRVPDAWYYAIMTAHGLGAFVGWFAFVGHLLGSTLKTPRVLTNDPSDWFNFRYSNPFFLIPLNRDIHRSP